MKRFISIVLVLMLLCATASADILLRHQNEAYCVAYSQDAQHCLMMAPLPEESFRYRMYIQHADGSVSQIVPTEACEVEPPDFERFDPYSMSIRVCGNMLLLDSSFAKWFVNMVTGEVTAQKGEVAGICGSQAAIIVSNGFKIGEHSASAVIRVLNGNDGQWRVQPVPDGVYIYAACPLTDGLLLSARMDDEYFLIWLDAAGNEIGRLVCASPCEQLYYDENGNTGLASRDAGTSWHWFTPYMIMLLQMPELDTHFDTIEEFLTQIDANPLHASLMPETAKTRSRMNSFWALGLTKEGDALCQWNKLGWLCTIDLTTLEVTPLLTGNDDLDTIMELGRQMYAVRWNGGTHFCLPGRMQPYQYIEIDHPKLQ